MPALAKPYSMKEAAAICGMSVHWLRARLSERIDLQAGAYKTRGRTGHIRFDPVAFAVWWAAYREEGTFVKPKPVRRPRRAKPRRYPAMDAGTTGAADCLSVLRTS